MSEVICKFCDGNGREFSRATGTFFGRCSPCEGRGVFYVEDECEDIQTTHVNPAIPMRDFDWSAVRRGYEPGDLMGWGATEQEAIDDLIEQESKQ